MAATNKQRVTRAASFKRIAKHLRVRSRNYAKIAKDARRQKQALTYDFFNFRAGILKELAEEFDNEATTLRTMK